jgi:diaminopimelate decarboxylase
MANGVKPQHIIFNGPDKSCDDLRKAIKNKSLIHIDNFDELYTIISLTNEINETPQVAIRVNMDTGVYPQWSRFGFNYDNGEAWDALNRIMINNKLSLVGLHAHIGTYMMSAQAYKVTGQKLSDLAVKLKEKYNHVIKYIDFGGGFASKNTLIGAYLPGSDTCPSFDDYAEAITSAVISSKIKVEDLPVIILETGRALIDDAGYILGTVLANKKLADGSNSTVIDVGVNLLFTSFWYEHKITPAQEFSPYTENTTIYGPLCMNIDVVDDMVYLPPLPRGTRLILSPVGAYNVTQWMQFIRYRPAVVLIGEKGEVELIREREDLSDIVGRERLPERLKLSWE